MAAFLKLYTDAAHTTEVAHTTQNATSINGNQLVGVSALPVASVANMPSQGYIDIIDGANNETIQYVSITGSTLNLAKAAAFAHNSGIVVNQWYYSLAVGDQTSGILNDGTNATPTNNNTGTWYVYNAGDQIAQSVAFSTVAGSPSTTNGYADSLISITSSATGFFAQVTPANMAIGGVQQIWVVADIPTGQSNVPVNQVCQLSFNYQSV